MLLNKHVENVRTRLYHNKRKKRNKTKGREKTKQSSGALGLAKSKDRVTKPKDRWASVSTWGGPGGLWAGPGGQGRAPDKFWGRYFFYFRGEKL